VSRIFRTFSLAERHPALAHAVMRISHLLVLQQLDLRLPTGQRVVATIDRKSSSAPLGFCHLQPAICDLNDGIARRIAYERLLVSHRV
jgi:hypothetical protein